MHGGLAGLIGADSCMVYAQPAMQGEGSIVHCLNVEVDSMKEGKSGMLIDGHSNLGKRKRPLDPELAL